MKRFLNTIKNIFKIEDLRTRILLTLGFILIYRLGAHIVIPGVNPEILSELQKAAPAKAADDLLGLLNMFSGGAFSNASIFALGIMPYISASIVVQLLGLAVPYFQKLQKEGESGRKKMNQITRFLTLGILILQAPTYIATQIPQEAVVSGGSFFTISSVIILMSGTMFVMWLGERITDRGIGNGISMIIMVGIIARLPYAFLGEILIRFQGVGGGLLILFIELIILFVIFMISIALVQAVRKIPVQYAKRVVGNKQYGGVRQYIPLKVNAAGVMPIIFAQALMFVPLMLSGFGGESMSGFATAFANYTGFWYNFTFATLIIIFTYFYTAVTINPQQMAEDMKKNGGFIPGVKPGKKTAEFMDTIMSRITLPGSIFLAFIAILPALVSLAGVDRSFAQFYGGTSLLILVGVVLDTLQQIESHLLMRHYDGLTKSGRIKGRGSVSAL